MNTKKKMRMGSFVSTINNEYLNTAA